MIRQSLFVIRTGLFFIVKTLSFRRKNSNLEVTSDVHVLYRQKSLIRLENVLCHHVLTINGMCDWFKPTIFVRLYLIVIKTCSDGFSDKFLYKDARQHEKTATIFRQLHHRTKSLNGNL